MTDQQNKPALNEATFEKLLEATWVLQEHNRKLRILEQSLEAQSEQLREQELANQALLKKTKPPNQDASKSDADYTLTLAQIVEAQHQIQMRHLDSDKAMAVVAERVARITSAAGAGIGLLDGATIRYRACAGSPALPVGTEVPLLKAVCQANIRTGQVIRTPDVNTEFLFDPEPCRARGILSLVAVPVHYDGNIVGALELYFERPQGYAEQDIHTCQLMAGLVTEAIGRETESKLKQSMSDERSTMLAEIERLRPSRAPVDERMNARSKKISEPAALLKTPCWKCGNTLRPTEVFCGHCGAPRAADDDVNANTLQSKLAFAWNQQQRGRNDAALASDGISLSAQSDFPAESDGFSSFSSADAENEDSEKEKTNALSIVASGKLSQKSGSLPRKLPTANINQQSNAIVKSEDEQAIWTSAAKAREFLESLSSTRAPGALRRFWRSRRGDFYLAIAIILVIVVIRWGFWSDHSVVANGGIGVSGSANRVRRPAPDADLSLFDKFLIDVGLADPPDDAPQYKGNPDTQVWVDLHTALYYCPGSASYGKTPKGKMSSQRTAQLDQFEPANRKACD